MNNNTIIENNIVIDKELNPEGRVHVRKFSDGTLSRTNIPKDIFYITDTIICYKETSNLIFYDLITGQAHDSHFESLIAPVKIANVVLHRAEKVIGKGSNSISVQTLLDNFGNPAAPFVIAWGNKVEVIDIPQDIDGYLNKLNSTLENALFKREMAFINIRDAFEMAFKEMTKEQE